MVSFCFLARYCSVTLPANLEASSGARPDARRGLGMDPLVELKSTGVPGAPLSAARALGERGIVVVRGPNFVEYIDSPVNFLGEVAIL